MFQVVHIGLIAFLRFFALFMVLPLVSLYVIDLSDGQTLWIGLAIGGYALTQTLVLFPMGRLSDVFGRKKIIIAGLFIFALGSAICAMSENIYLFSIGRLIQGVGVVSSVAMALIADLTNVNERDKAMGIFGIFIGMSFVFSVAIGPILAGSFGVKNLFWLAFLLAMLALVIAFFLPDPQRHTRQEPIKFKEVIENKKLLWMDFFMFFHSFVMTSMFFSLPIFLNKIVGVEKVDLYKFFVPSTIFAFLMIGLSIMLHAKKVRLKVIFGFWIGVLFLGFVLASFATTSLAFLFISMLLFAGSISIEPLLQSSATKLAKVEGVGSSMGVFNSFQYLAILIAGFVNAHVFDGFALYVLAILLASVCAVWFVFNLFMPIKM